MIIIIEIRIKKIKDENKYSEKRKFREGATSLKKNKKKIKIK